MTEPLDPPYLRIAAEIGQRIADGELQPGARVPSTRQIAAQWGVALATAAKALTALRQQGLVTARPRSGTVVTVPGPARGGIRHREIAPNEHELSSERVVRAAIGIADRDGLDALSMRGVAARLGVAAMSPYRYVTSKDELVLMMTDVAFGEVDYPDRPPTDWRRRIELAARALWQLYHRHPWLAQLSPPTGPLPLPNLIRHADWALAAFDGLGLDPATMRNVIVLVYSFIQGLAANLSGDPRIPGPAHQPAGQSRDTLASGLAAYANSGRYPTFANVAHALAQRGDHLELDEIFELGLQVLLAGLAAHILQ